MAEKGFDHELLKQSGGARLKWFRDEYLMKHPILLDVIEELLCAIRYAAPETLIIVTGPAGVGKTTLQKRIERLLTEEILHELEVDPGRHPFVRIEAKPTSGKYDWKYHFKQILLAMNDPCVDHKRNPDWQQVDRIVKAALTPVLGLKEAEYAHAVEQALIYRRPVAVVVDEAQRTIKTASGKMLIDRLDVIRSMADRTHIPHALMGNYDLRTFGTLGSQSNRRCVDIHFRRYLAESSKDRKAFRGVLKTFECYVPVHERPQLEHHWEFLFERSIGCVGVLKDWLIRALGRALEDDAKTIKLAHLEKTAQSVLQCDIMLTEALVGEKKLAESKTSIKELRRKLGLIKKGQGGGKNETAKDETSSGESAEEKSNTQQKNSQPGTRAAKRDAVGRNGGKNDDEGTL